ncbi:MAG: dTDP-4-dehydrorhamnose 3,5-epimerase [Verrucomicrobia bacterium RIFCSPLOWO2_12_FULL_64_8]|nr:MAG: dTDP-4-dehydrorhamnose 3,5-epimerase [Verrucomicrobia bacterium RIFCSPLOWO2_12_FULL_64_8]
MKVTECEMAGLLLIEPKVFGDLRGFFLESWNRDRYRAAGIPDDFVQDNFSFSGRGTLRGLHFQNPRTQGKLVSVWQGEVWDVAVDIRRQSRPFGRWLGMTLSAENKRQLYVPPGFAHGFVVLSETALFHYKCTNDYSPKDEIGFRWDDPAVGIQWPVARPVLSSRDAQAPLLREIPEEKLF